MTDIVEILERQYARTGLKYMLQAANEIERLHGLLSDMQIVMNSHNNIVGNLQGEIERLRGLLRELLDNNWLPDSWAGSTERLVRERVREALGE